MCEIGRWRYRRAGHAGTVRVRVQVCGRWEAGVSGTTVLFVFVGAVVVCAAGTVLLAWLVHRVNRRQ